MALFVVRHEHDPDRCPARDPDLGAALLNHLSRPNLDAFGVTIRGDAVVEGAHSLVLIAEAADEARLREFMAPFAAAGTVEILPASTCARVVTSGGCAAPAPALDDEYPAVDPGAACEHAIAQGLLVHRAHPLNAETSIPALIGGVVMPTAHFYVRNHFQTPALDTSAWRLHVGGLVDRPLDLSLQDLHGLPSTSHVVTLECAGNGRYRLDPPADGEQWQLGAVSTAEWTGVPLLDVLDRAGVRPEARELVFRGADRGVVPERGSIAFERSLMVDTARESDAILAYAMNGEPLPVQHGFPVRLVVPGWYGVASVKWLVGIDAVADSFDGYYQRDKYWYEWPTDDGPVREPVTLQRVRALITEPADGAEVETGEVLIRGVAWSGAAPLARVDVRVGDREWCPARLVGERHLHGWQWWELRADLGGRESTTISARATDQAGNSQPDQPPWNSLGYGNNAVQRVTVRCRDS